MNGHRSCRPVAVRQVAAGQHPSPCRHEPGRTILECSRLSILRSPSWSSTTTPRSSVSSRHTSSATGSRSSPPATVRRRWMRSSVTGPPSSFSTSCCPCSTAGRSSAPFEVTRKGAHADPGPLRAGLDRRPIAGFEDGADDYLPKPFSPAELVLRIRRILRRGQSETVTKPASAVAANGRVRPMLTSLSTRSVRGPAIRSAGNAHAPSSSDFSRSLLEADGRVLTRDQLLDAVYGERRDGGSRSHDRRPHRPPARQAGRRCRRTPLCGDGERHWVSRRASARADDDPGASRDRHGRSRPLVAAAVAAGDPRR